ncbi:MAG: efflux RND transporter permease subunit [Acidobacteriota bacterium]|nr:efflux RND transporter permease subunit [Acidobacteriota bacterium]
MWIVKIALSRPYTFIVLAILILIGAPVVILSTPTDIFPSVDIPVISMAWAYTGLNPEEMEGRLTTPFERSLTTLVDNIEHVESTTISGVAIVKVYLQPGASLDTANAQVSAVSEFMLKNLPPGTLPPEIVDFSASSVPIIQLGLSGEGLSEQQLNDFGLNFIRAQLVTVSGAVVPNVYGGKQRSVMLFLDPKRLQATGLAPNDVLSAMASQNVVLPGGTAKIGHDEYDIHINASPLTLEGISNIPLRQVNGTTIYVHDVATVSDGSIPQTNIVRQNGRRGVLITVLKSGRASTLSVVSGIRRLLPTIAQTVPPALKITPIGDQSIFVRASIAGVVREAVIAAVLTGLMILLFLGSWRSTIIIAVSIPLSILTSVIVLGLIGQTINIMTLGGLALAVGILVDDATVEIENVNRNLEMGKELREAILDGAQQIAVPALVSTLCICIVFLPMFFLSGVSRYLFVPLAEAVVFAMLASYLLSRTLVPTLAMYLLKAHEHEQHDVSRNPFTRFQRRFEYYFEKVRSGYEDLLERLVSVRNVFVPVFLLVCTCAFLLVPFLGRNFFPSSDTGSFILHLRAKSGTRIEETAKLCDLVEQDIRKTVPAGEMDNILDNIGLPYSPLNLQHSNSGLIGPGDADILVSLQKKHRPTAEYVAELRKGLARSFPGVTFYFLPSDIVTQILNFGLPAPIDVQFEGADIAGNRKVADKVLDELRHVPGLVDLRIQQPDDYPVLTVNVDRTKAVQGGYTLRDVGGSLQNLLSGSSQLTPMFFLNYKNGVNYSMVAEAPQYDIQTLDDLENVPLSAPTARQPEILADVANITRSTEMQTINHYNLRRTLDIYGSVQDTDLGAVSKQIDRIVAENKGALPRGTFVHIRGQIETMNTSYFGLIAGLGFAIVLVYLLVVVNFQSWLDPFIIITALPAALTGIVLFLFVTRTTLSVPALMGAIMCMGVATANSILVVSFAKERLEETHDAVRSAVEAGATRFRPVCMTALAMIIGMVPMALGLGEGGEQNAPLGRAVIGGLLLATLATLVFVPAVFALLHGRGGRAAGAADPERRATAEA